MHFRSHQRPPNQNSMKWPHSYRWVFGNNSPHGQIKGDFFFWFMPWWNSLCRDWQRLAFSLTSLHLVVHLGSAGWEMSGMVRYTFACWNDVRAVFMRHHKYACCFLLYSGVTVFPLSEVIYLSSTVTVGMNKTGDNYTSHLPDRMILKALSGCGGS